MVQKLVSFLREVFIYDERKFHEKYLSEATDIYDLEYRQRQLDRNRTKNIY